MVLFKPSKEFKNFINSNDNGKSINAYKTIGEVVKILNLKSRKGVLHQLILMIRFWEKILNKLKPKFLMEIEDTMIKKHRIIT